MYSIDKEVLKALKEMYPTGTRVKLVKMDDPFSPPEPGTCGTVNCIDDTGTIFVSWDTGSSLGVLYGVDEIIKEGTSVE